MFYLIVEMMSYYVGLWDYFDFFDVICFEYLDEFYLVWIVVEVVGFRCEGVIVEICVIVYVKFDE